MELFEIYWELSLQYEKGYEVNVTRDDVFSLLTAIDAIVEKTAEQVMK